MKDFDVKSWRNTFIFEGKLSDKQLDIAKLDPPTDELDAGDFKKLRNKKGVEEHHNDPNFPGGPAIHDLLDRVGEDWGTDSELYNTLEDAIVANADKSGNLTPMGKEEIKRILDNYDVLFDYRWILEPKPADHTGETTSMNEEGKESKLEKFERILYQLQNMNKLSNPSDEATKREKIKDLEDKIAKLKSKVAEGEDHEVSMAHNSLESIIKNAMELKAKLGDDEKDIPAWIQDHITNAANFISQAAENYHEYGEEEQDQF